MPIASTRRLTYLEEDLATLTVRLTLDEFSQTDIILPAGAASGEQHPAHSRQTVNR